MNQDHTMQSYAPAAAEKIFKTPPYSLEAEQSILGGVLLSNESWDQVIEIVHEDDFYDPKHKVLFRAIQSLANESEPLDVVTVSERLSKTQELTKIGNTPYLIGLVENTPSAANITSYANIVREKSILRKLIQAGTKIIESAYNTQGRKSNEILDEAENNVFKIADQNIRGKGLISIRDVLKETVDKIDKIISSGSQMTGTATGYTDLDLMTAGLQPSDLIIVAGRPSMGKTLLGVNIAEYIAIKNPDKAALIFSLEMPADALAMRLLSSLGRIDQTKVRAGDLDEDDWPRFTAGVAQLSATKLFIDDTPALSPSEVRARARRIAREHGEISVIVVDYLQLMQLKGHVENRAYEISEISRSLKALAKELNVPIIALSQLNRELEKRPNKRPVMSDLRESGAIEQDADLIAFIYRDEVYDEDSEDRGIAEVIIAKQRNGPIGTVRLAFYGHLCRFDNLAPEFYEDI